jgi:hypothetical protein
VDVGTLHGYREAMRLLGGQDAAPFAPPRADPPGGPTKLERSEA